MKFAVLPLLALGFCLPLSAAWAEGTCENPSLNQAFSTTEEEFSFANFDRNDVTDPRQGDRSVSSSDWAARAGAFEVKAFSGPPLRDDNQGSGVGHCNYDTAIEVLDELELQLGRTHPYLKRWVENQSRVLEACRTGQRGLPLLEPAPGEDWPARAASDLAYQKSTLKFYTQIDFDRPGLEAEYVQQAQDATSPMQGRAATMALRLALMNGGIGHLMDVAEGLRTNPATEKAYAFAEDTIFTPFWGYRFSYGLPESSADDLQKRLQWLVDVALERNVPHYSDDARTQARFREWRRRDAVYQLKALTRSRWLGREDAQPPHGWWFAETALESPYFESARLVAATEPYLDYIAMRNIKTPLTSWRWALYDLQSPVWTRSQRIADHALQRFCSGGGVEWLYEAARVLPPTASEIPLVRAQLDRALDDTLLHQRQPLLRLYLHEQAVRLALLAGDDAKAQSLLVRTDITDPSQTGARGDEYGNSYRRNEQVQHIKAATFYESWAWYAHQGRGAEVQKLAAQLPDLYQVEQSDYRNRILSFLIAPTLEKAIEVWSERNMYGGSPMLFLFDLLPTEKVLTMAEDTGRGIMTGSLREALAPRLLLRSWLLGDAALVERAVSLYGQAFPALRGEVTRAFSGDRFDQALFVLRHQDIPFAGPYLFTYVGADRTTNLRNWGGLWCQLQPDDYTSASDTFWEFEPEGSPMRRSGWSWGRLTEGMTYDPEKFAAARRAVYLAHPFWQAADRDELAQLAAIAPGPDYLPRIINSYARWPVVWNRMMGRGDDVPEALHLAVRAARFGCHRNGIEYGTSSRTAFRLLHGSYAGTLWAEATPYWYK